MIKEIIMALICVIMLSTFTYAQPDINAISDTWAHGSTVTITGNDFGSKSIAEPIIWDDFESGDLQSHWIARLPSEAATSNESYKPNVNTTGWRGVASAHPNSQYYATAGHDPAGYNPWSNRKGPNAMISFNVIPPITSETAFYLRYYYRHDPLWNGPFDNLKICDFSNWDAQESNMWPHHGGGHDYYVEYRGVPLAGSIGLHTVHSNMGECSGYNYPCDYGMHPPEPNQGWHVYEYIILHNSTNGFFRVYINNELMYEKGVNNDCNEFSYDINSIWLGGYFRATRDPETGDVDGYRYFDDVYADRGFQRVILANSSTYNNATIIEPQIPSAWSENSITCTVNLGRLPASGVAYLFVFDADNNHNPRGYPVDINGTAQLDEDAPDAPTGIEVVSIEY